MMDVIRSPTTSSRRSREETVPGIVEIVLTERLLQE
jgi:hypothetical protein